MRGSARSVPGFHIRDALAGIDRRCPGLMVRFGGHAMAAGLTLMRPDYPRFADAFDAVVRETITPESLQASLRTDGELQPDEFTLALARELRAAGPWGQGFPPPLFDNVFECVASKAMGQGGAHRRLRLLDPRSGCVLEAVWFQAAADIPGHTPVRVAYELAVNTWRGQESLQLVVRHAESLGGAHGSLNAT